MKKSYLSLIAIMLTLTGCSLSPVSSDPNSTYLLNTLPSHIPNKHRDAGTIFVMAPQTQPSYNTTRMAYTAKPYQIAYFARSQWAETPSQMLQPLIVQSLQNTHYYHAVASAPYMGKYRYVLTTDIIKLQQNYVMQPVSAEFYVRAQLSQATTGQVIATKLITVRVPIRCKTPYGGVMASNHATGKLLAELTNFCIEHT